MEENMQPDPLTPQPEEKQPDPSPVQEKKPAKRNVGSIILGILVVLLLVAVAGLGYWAYTLNTDLIATQGELTSLQAEHEQLKTDLASAQSDNDQLTADLNQAKADLEKTNGDLTTAGSKYKSQ